MGTLNHLYIVTGSLRGLGQSMLELLMQPTHAIIVIASHHDPELKARANLHGSQLVQWVLDLSESTQVSRRLSDWLALQPAERFASSQLIHLNDGFPRPSSLQEVGPADMAHTIRSNLETPLSLLATYLRGTQRWPHARKALLISPFAPTRHVPHQVAQLALNEAAELCGSEQAGAPHPAAVVCLNLSPLSPEQNHEMPQLAQRCLAHLQSTEFGQEASLSWSSTS